MKIWHRRPVFAYTCDCGAVWWRPATPGQRNVCPECRELPKHCKEIMAQFTGVYRAGIPYDEIPVTSIKTPGGRELLNPKKP